MTLLSRKLRISLRGALVGTAVLAVWVGWKAELGRRQSRVADWAALHNGTVTYDRYYEIVDKDLFLEDHEHRSWYVPQWLRKQLGENFASTITIVSVQNAELTDITPIAQLHSLEGVAFHNNHLTGIEPLKEVDVSTLVFLSENQIDDISALAGMTNLKKIDLRSNQVRDLAPLKALKQLLSLDLTNNRIVDVSPLEGLTNVKELSLRKNRIGDVTPLLNLKSLKVVDVRETGLDDTQIQLLKNALPNTRVIVD